MSTSSSVALSIPTHVGIIPDGNRRWARSAGKSTLQGHQKGLEVARLVMQELFDRGVEYFSLYAFSIENWNRTQEEIGYLMTLFERLLVKDLRELEAKGARFRLIGSREGLPASLVKAIDDAEDRTDTNTGGTIGLCLNYGGREELVHAADQLAARGVKGPHSPEQLAEFLYAPEIPPLDMIIRTSGEQRTSGFMLARSSYAELHFVDKNWPDFTVDDLDQTLSDYARRQRRFGA